MKIGVVLARFQPIHNGHIELIRKSYEENDKTIIVIGSYNRKYEIRNPLPGSVRLHHVLRTIAEEFNGLKQFKIVKLPDWSSESDVKNFKEWGRYLYYNIISSTKGEKNFSIYYSDDPSIMLSWFEDDLKERIDFRFLDRDNIKDGISATKIREAIEVYDCDFISKNCPKVVNDNFFFIRDYIMGSLDRNRNKI